MSAKLLTSNFYVGFFPLFNLFVTFSPQRTKTMWIGGGNVLQFKDFRCTNCFMVALKDSQQSPSQNYIQFYFNYFLVFLLLFQINETLGWLKYIFCWYGRDRATVKLGRIFAFVLIKKSFRLRFPLQWNEPFFAMSGWASELLRI